MQKVDQYWCIKHEKILERARRPLPSRVDPVPQSDPVAEIRFKNVCVGGALIDMEDCICSGRQMNILTFKKVSYNAFLI